MGSTRMDRLATMLRSSGVFALGVAALVAAVAVFVVGWSLRDGPGGNEDATPTFSTTATGTVEVPPSSATTRVGLQACGEGPGLALQQLNRRFASMSKSWRDADIPERAISRGNLTTYRRSRTRWCSSLDAVATVHDLDTVDEVLTGIARYPRGIQFVRGPVFDYDPATLEEGALDEAMRVARRKADDAAKRAGSRVVGVASIVEGGVSVERPEDVAHDGGYVGLAGGTSMVATTANRELLVSRARAINNASGEATATVSVEAVFRLEA